MTLNLETLLFNDLAARHCSFSKEDTKKFLFDYAYTMCELLDIPKTETNMNRAVMYKSVRIVNGATKAYYNAKSYRMQLRVHDGNEGARKDKEEYKEFLKQLT